MNGSRDTERAANPISTGGPRKTEVRVVAVAALVALSAVWIGLALTTFFVGPAEWDDNQYCDIAAVPRGNTYVVNRYVHIWTLRLFYLVMDSHRTAAGLYSSLTVVGLMWVAFFLGRRMSGVGCGLVAAVLMPLYPVLLKYLTVPYCDEPAALWGGAALVCALIASERRAPRGRWMLTVATGLFCFLSVKCKETGLAVFLPALLLLWSRSGKIRSLGQWAAGLLMGWGLLTLLDLAFTNDAWFSWRWSSYFPDRRPNPNPTIRMGAEYIEFLSSRTFLAFSLLGVAGALVSFRENRVVRCVALWLLGVVLFQSLIAWKFRGIQALDRYCVGIGVPLVILSAHWIVTQWRRPTGEARGYSIGVVLALVVVVGPALYGLASVVTDGVDAKSGATRAFFFMVPMSVVLLFAVPWLTPRRLLVRISLLVIVAMACVLSVHWGLQYVEKSKQKLAPWLELTTELDKTGAHLAKWKMPGKPLSPPRIAWRCRALSGRPPERIQVRRVKTLDEIEDNEWLFTGAKWWRSDTRERREMLSRGWVPFVNGSRQGFVVCGRKGERPGGDG